MSVRRVREIEELCHIGLNGITPRQIGQVEAFFHQFEDCGEVHGCMGNVTRFGKRRNHEQWHAEAGAGKVSGRIAGLKIARRNAVRVGDVLAGRIGGILAGSHGLH